MIRYLILAGSNLNDPPARLAEALDFLKDLPGKLIISSMVYCSPPWGYSSSALYYNQAHVLESPLKPPALLEELLAVECAMGRLRSHSPGYQDRTIDLDILLAEDLVWQEEALKIPHPRLHIRRFALVPAAEIAGSWRHPILKETLNELLARCADPLPVYTFTP